MTVTETALVRRINRRLIRNDGYLRLRIARGTVHDGQWYENTNFGRFYVLDIYSSALIETHIDLERYGQGLGVLGEDEELRTE